MQFREYSTKAVNIQLSSFCPQGGTAEYHVMLHLTDLSACPTFERQLDALLDAEKYLFSELIPNASVAIRRRFLSQPQAVSCSIGQKPLDGTLAAEWIYALGAKLTGDDNERVYESNGRRHIWNSASCVPLADSASETSALLEGFEARLQEFGGNIADNCVRTWFFVDDIDNNYAGLVKARRENFNSNGLNSSTHYIASTGIGGRPCLKDSIVQMDSYSILSLPAPEQVFLTASANMNRTIDYGVTFERAVMIPYGDRKHVIISGTASIDNKGAVLHVGDVVRQTGRMLENVSMLLAEGMATFDDVNHIIVYLRNEEDYDKVAPIFREKFPSTPLVILLAPVCRPDWLIEMECMATVPSSDCSRLDF